MLRTHEFHLSFYPAKGQPFSSGCCLTKKEVPDINRLFEPIDPSSADADRLRAKRREVFRDMALRLMDAILETMEHHEDGSPSFSVALAAPPVHSDG